jgi:class 3 adenylate cyclase
MSRDDEVRRFMARWERLSASPSATITVLRMGAEIDTRHILPAIRVPTLVLHRAEDTLLPVQCGRDLARTIPGAEYVELPGNNHVPLFEPDIVDRIVGEVEEFLTGSRSETETDRVLATVMFTDIVESTKRAAELGDRQWRALLERHDETVRQQLVRFRGQEVKNLGDGFLATFDGPARAVRCASAIAETVRPLGIAVRSGLHTGEIELKPHDIAGIAVHIASRVAHLGGADVLVSRTVKDLVAGSGIKFEDFGMHTLKGIPETWQVFRAIG